MSLFLCTIRHLPSSLFHPSFLISMHCYKVINGFFNNAALHMGKCHTSLGMEKNWLRVTGLSWPVFCARKNDEWCHSLHPYGYSTLFCGLFVSWSAWLLCIWRSLTIAALATALAICSANTQKDSGDLFLLLLGALHGRQGFVFFTPKGSIRLSEITSQQG